MERSCIYYDISDCPHVIIYHCGYDAPALGLANDCRGKWTWFLDIDGDQIPDAGWWLVAKTRRGRHVYLDVWEDTFDAALSRALKYYSVADPGQLMLALERRAAGMPFSLVIRLAGKYTERDIRIEAVRKPRYVPTWYAREILKLIKTT